MLDLLFPFQLEDVEKLQDQSSALIANQMGTGKTYVALGRDELIRQEYTGRTLIVAPLTTLTDVWAEHVNKITSLSCVVVNPKARKSSWKEFIGPWKPDVFIVHWEGLRLMPELATIPWLHIIADECQRMKNRKTQMTQALKAIKDVSWKTAMSGTPVVNRPDELWSVLNWLYPRDYRSYWRFFNAHVEYQQSQIRGRVIRQVIGPKDTDTLQEAIAPWYVRRLKKDVLKDLPPKYWTERKVDLTPTQRTAYNMMRDNMIAWIGQQQEDVLPAPVVIAQLTRLQQFSAAYAEYSESGAVRLAEPSSKLDAVMEILDEAGELQVVVFSRFKGTLALLEKRLAADNITYDTLTGDTPQETRAAAVQRFQRGHARVFLGTIQAGGVGITLTAASTVIFIDRDWSPALNEQAEDRLHRIGQKDAVQVIDIIARNTVDLGKLQKVEVKKQWIRQMLGDK